jgi:hypothetical protein
MQNLNEEDFKKKYLKYKAKYLELKDLLEGGAKEDKDKQLCESTSKGFCSIYTACKDGFFSGCNFNINEYIKSEPCKSFGQRNCPTGSSGRCVWNNGQGTCVSKKS